MTKDKQILDYTDEELTELVYNIMSEGSVVLHDQDLDRQNLIEACKRIGKVEELDYFMNPKDAPQISIVSGKVVDGKAIGMFGPTELEWHANGTGRYNFDEICVGLYCVEECVDTVLSLVNQREAFEELSEEEKNYYRDIDINLNNNGKRSRIWRDDGVYSKAYKNQGEQSFRTGQEHYKEEVDRRPLVAKHPVDGKEYLYPMFIYMYKAWHKDGTPVKNFDEFKNKLYEKITRSRYMKHHVFRKGDLLFMDQLLTSHRRSAVKNKDRQLWRTAFDYSKSIKNYQPVKFELSQEIPWPDITITNDKGKVPLRENYAFKDMWYLDTPQAKPIFEKQADIIIEKQSKGIIDIGCRHGPVIEILHEKGYKDFQYMGFDTSSEPIEIAQERWKEFSNIEFRNESWDDMDTFLVDFPVDQVIWSGVLLYKPEDHFDFFKKITKDLYKSKNAIIQEPYHEQKYWDDRLILNRISDEFNEYKNNCKEFKEHIVDAKIFAGCRVVVDVTL